MPVRRCNRAVGGCAKSQHLCAEMTAASPGVVLRQLPPAAVRATFLLEHGNGNVVNCRLGGKWHEARIGKSFEENSSSKRARKRVLRGNLKKRAVSCRIERINEGFTARKLYNKHQQTQKGERALQVSDKQVPCNRIQNGQQCLAHLPTKKEADKDTKRQRSLPSNKLP